MGRPTIIGRGFLHHGNRAGRDWTDAEKQALQDGLNALTRRHMFEPGTIVVTDGHVTIEIPGLALADIPVLQRWLDAETAKIELRSAPDAAE